MTPLPPMPGNVVRVYPASGAVAMLPLTPANNYTPTILFCGGSDMPDEAWGNYAFPAINTWEYPASNDCQRITPEPTDGSQVAYVEDDNMLQGRTMGQFIILPNGKLLVVNGGLNGTAGYSQQTGLTPTYDQMPFGESLASGPVGTPAIYDPSAPAGSRWSNEGFATSNIARLYHSSAILLPDASVLIAGSNPNIDVNTTTIFPTTYQAEIFYPPYFSASVRPQPSGMPKTISYGGDLFNITVPSSSYTGAPNDAAANTTVVLIRGGFTTHAMNMGQRFLQLNNTFTVQDDGTIILHVAQAPPNPYIFQPGPAFLYVVISDIPSNGSYVIVGNGQIGQQPTSPSSVLPDNVLSSKVGGSAGGSGGGSSGNSDASNSSSSGTSTGAIVGGVVGGLAFLAVIAAGGILFLRKRRSSASNRGTYPQGPRGGPGYSLAANSSNANFGSAVGVGAGAVGALNLRGHMMAPSDSSSLVPLNQEGKIPASGDPSMGMAYKDESRTSVGGQSGLGGYPMQEVPYDPYARDTGSGQNRF